MKSLPLGTRSGQITLIAILLGILGLTVGLSVASRSLADLKQASYVDFGTKAFAAAEAGAELGLNDIATNNLTGKCGATPAAAYPGSLTFASSYGLSSVTYTVCPDPNPYVLKNDVQQDDVVQVDVPSNSNPNLFYVFWNDTASYGVEISELMDSYDVHRFAFYSSSANGTNFASPVTSGFYSTNCPSAGFKFQSQPIDGVKAIMLRVKPLNGPSNILICNSSGIPAQSYVVTATATTKNNTVRRVQVTKDIVGPLPSVFDNVIYSGGSLTK